MRSSPFGRLQFAALAGFACLAGVAYRADAAAITLGNITLQPNRAGQTVSIFVTGGDAVQGLNFNLQVADGGPEAGGTIVGPRITGVGLVTGTIFGSNNTGVRDPGSLPQLAIRTLTTATGTVAASGLLATVTFDTTGITPLTVPFTYELRLTGTANGDTDFAGIPISITNGTLTVAVVPEPATAVGLAAASLLITRRRR